MLRLNSLKIVKWLLSRNKIRSGKFVSGDRVEQIIVLSRPHTARILFLLSFILIIETHAWVYMQLDHVWRVVASFDILSSRSRPRRQIYNRVI